MSTTSRILRLLALLQTHRDWTGEELASRLEVSPRTVRRDVDRLRELGYPVRAIIGPAGGYRLEAGVTLPPLLLDDEEAVAIAIGLRTAAGASVTGIDETSVRALAKLEQVLPSRLAERVNTLQTYTVPLGFAGPTVEPHTLSVIAQACRDHLQLRFLYQRRDGATGERLVEPYRLVSAGRRWYLVAWDVERRDWRTFRVDRLDTPRPSTLRFTPRELPAEDAAAFVEQAMTGSAARHRAVVSLHAPLSSVAGKIHPGMGQLEVIDEHTCRLTTTTDSIEWLAMIVGALDVDFVIHEPVELVDHVRKLAERFAASVAATDAAQG